ncbi:hypothetical protein RHGRI_013249 [Rhododendron griersonianum]|uniref:Uncharacterized protein n=1 Tax=Rhododendron griersonianum TaxID=479676 RepID=A0AAV6K530_9ERIC|nr:hypothetical protein RHGRI_013249 [Rhododendron griersonianum]
MFLDYFQAISDENRQLFEVESTVAPGSSGTAGTENLAIYAGGYIGYVVPIEYCIELLKWTRGGKKTDSIFMYGDDEEN